MFRDRVRQVRVWSGMKKAELSRLCGFRESYLSAIERHPKPEVGRSKLVAFCITCGVDGNWLLFNLPERAPTQKAVREAVAYAQAKPDEVRRRIDILLDLVPPPAAVEPAAKRSKRRVARPS